MRSWPHVGTWGERHERLLAMKRSSVISFAGLIVVVSALGAAASLGLNTDAPETMPVSPATSAAETNTSSETGNSSENVDTVCKQQCVTKRLVEITSTEGAAKAFAWYQEIVEMDSGLAPSCHSAYETIGRAVAKSEGLVRYETEDCQFGFLHGVLYGIAETYDDGDQLVADIEAYCNGYLADGGLSNPQGNCYHGLGHALADVVSTDIRAAVAGCGKTGTSTAANACADGVYMEYGDDNLMRNGWLPAKGVHGNSLKETKYEISDVAGLCLDAPEYAVDKCWFRMSKFVAPGATEEYATVAQVCMTAANEQHRAECVVGFGEVAIRAEAEAKTYAWPPDTTAEADDLARRFAARCELFPLPGSCITGVITAATSHLYSAKWDEELIPNPCLYMDARYVAECNGARRAARELSGVG
jgi:hypothetical protein